MVFKMRPFSLPKPRSQEHPSTVRKFSWTELQLATDNFSVHNVVGRGGFGGVYKGVLPDGSVVVVKRHTKNTNNSLGDAQFKAEVQVGECEASDHGNVIRLLGYCRTTRERLLVYPFMVNGSLASRLWKRPPSQPPLDWASRMQIALGAAKGLAHLHSGSSFPVIHRDIKPDNILLDDQFEAVLSDFGLAKFVGRKGNESNTCWVSSSSEEEYGDDNDFEEEESDEDKSGFTKSCWNFTRTFMLKSEDHKADFLELFPHVSTRVMGTMGYADPEYIATGRCSIKSDVFGYGIILLELISGRRGIDRVRQHKDDEYLLQWVKRLVAAKKSHLVVDPDLKGGFRKKKMKQVLQLALLCTSNTPQERPAMSEVINKIENICKLQPHGQIVGGAFVHRFSLPELKSGTQNFSNKNARNRSSFNHAEQSKVIQRVEDTHNGDLQVCFDSDHAKLFRFHDPPRSELPHEFEVGAMMDSPQLDIEWLVSSELDQPIEVQHSLKSTPQIISPHQVDPGERTTNSSHFSLTLQQDTRIYSKDKEAVFFKMKPTYSSAAQHTKVGSQSKGITIVDHVWEPKIHDRLHMFLSDIVTDALPTKLKLCQSGMSMDPLCPFCNEYEEDTFHLFFKCDFSRQAWQLAVGVRIDMLGFGSVKEAVDVILNPNAAGINIIPPDVEPIHFSHKGVALMDSIWTHRNQVCFDKLPPNVIQMLKDHPHASALNGIEPPRIATQFINQSQPLTQQALANGHESEATSDTTGAVSIASNHINSIQLKSSHEIEPTQLQPEPALLPLVSKPVTTNNQQYDFQVDITSAGFSLNLKLNKQSVMWIILLTSLCMNFVSIWR